MLGSEAMFGVQCISHIDKFCFHFPSGLSFSICLSLSVSHISFLVSMHTHKHPSDFLELFQLSQKILLPIHFLALEVHFHHPPHKHKVIKGLMIGIGVLNKVDPCFLATVERHRWHAGEHMTEQTVNSIPPSKKETKAMLPQ